MARAIASLQSRRLRHAAIVAALALVVLVIGRLSAISLGATGFASGWALLLLVIVLTALNGRKKVPFLPLGTTAAWLQLHIYGGLLAVAIFGVHIDFRIPNGPLETLLAWFFLLVSISGVVGLWLSRVIPRRLANCEEEVLFERIPAFTRELRETAEEVVASASGRPGSEVLADHYSQRLHGYFRGPADFWYHAAQSERRNRQREERLAGLERYLDAEGIELAGRLRELVEKKNELDYHHALQGVLKRWLFVHIPLTYGMLVLAAVHLLVVHRFALPRLLP